MPSEGLRLGACSCGHSVHGWCYSCCCLSQRASCVLLCCSTRVGALHCLLKWRGTQKENTTQVAFDATRMIGRRARQPTPFFPPQQLLHPSQACLWLLSQSPCQYLAKTTAEAVFAKGVLEVVTRGKHEILSACNRSLDVVPKRSYSATTTEKRL